MPASRRTWTGPADVSDAGVADAARRCSTEIEQVVPVDPTGRRGGRGHLAAYDRADRLMRSSSGARRSTSTRSRRRCATRYGRNLFGQGCLLARRLVEQGVPFVEVHARQRLGHARRTTSTVKRLCACSTRPGRADGRPEGPRPARHHDHRLDGRVRPHAEDQPAQRPRPLRQRLEHGAGRRRHQGRPGERQDEQTGWTVGEPGDARPAGDALPALGIDTRRQTRRTSAGRSGSWTRTRTRCGKFFSPPPLCSRFPSSAASLLSFPSSAWERTCPKLRFESLISVAGLCEAGLAEASYRKTPRSGASGLHPQAELGNERKKSFKEPRASARR